MNKPKKLYLASFYSKGVTTEFNQIGIGELSIIPMYESLLPKVESKPIRKILFDIASPQDESTKFEVLIDIARIPLILDLHNYKQKDSKQKMRILLDLVQGEILLLAERFGWSADPFRKVYNEILSREFHFDGYWGKPKKNASRSVEAQLYWHFFDAIHVYLELRSPEARRLPFLTLAPAFGALNEVATLKWEDDNLIKVLHSNKRDYWLIDVAAGEVEFHYPRAENGDPYGQYDLGMMYLNGNLVRQDKARALHWIRLAAQNNYNHAIKLLPKLEETPNA